eukprot:GHVH01005819.1.p1 GENE.GHVH01005819.1~~GHVH01005819.1.p1  ORF type:complete len:580 (+),score=99.32 GHVH01005819.1:1352-3091(+)
METYAMISERYQNMIVKMRDIESVFTEPEPDVEKRVHWLQRNSTTPSSVADSINQLMSEVESLTLTTNLSEMTTSMIAGTTVSPYDPPQLTTGVSEFLSEIRTDAEVIPVTMVRPRDWKIDDRHSTMGSEWKVHREANGSLSISESLGSSKSVMVHKSLGLDSGLVCFCVDGSKLQGSASIGVGFLLDDDLRGGLTAVVESDQAGGSNLVVKRMLSDGPPLLVMREPVAEEDTVVELNDSENCVIFDKSNGEVTIYLARGSSISERLTVLVNHVANQVGIVAMHSKSNVRISKFTAMTPGMAEARFPHLSRHLFGREQAIPTRIIALTGQPNPHDLVDLSVGICPLDDVQPPKPPINHYIREEDLIRELARIRDAETFTDGLYDWNYSDRATMSRHPGSDNCSINWIPHVYELHPVHPFQFVAKFQRLTGKSDISSPSQPLRHIVLQGEESATRLIFYIEYLGENGITSSEMISFEWKSKSISRWTCNIQLSVTMNSKSAVKTIDRLPIEMCDDIIEVTVALQPSDDPLTHSIAIDVVSIESHVRFNPMVRIQGHRLMIGVQSPQSITEIQHIHVKPIT